MKYSKLLNRAFFHFIKILLWIVLIFQFNIANAGFVTVKVEDAGVFNWDSIQQWAPGFGSNGPVSLNWNPNNDFFTELLAYDKGYSGGAAAFCWYGESCALQLSVTAENTAIHLQSFVLGYYGYGNYVQYNVVDMATQTSILQDSPWVDGNLSSIVSVNASSNIGFMILFGPDGFNGGINNITYSYLATPIPAATWLFGTGLVALISFTRQSRLYQFVKAFRD